MLDLRLFPIAYGLGYVTGLYVALAGSVRRGTKLSEEAADVPLYLGLIFASGYLYVLVQGLL